MEKTLISGFAYQKDSEDHIVNKLKFLPGSTHTFDDSLTIVEVNTESELDAISLYIEPETQQQINERKIAEEMRKIAIDNLILRDELPEDYV